MNFFLGMWMALLLISTVSMTEGSVLGEIQRGTAAWLAALPITRPSIIISKFVGSMVGNGAAATMETLATEPWVTDVRPVRDGEWEIYSKDQSVAEQRVLRSLVNSNGSRVVSLRPMQRSLEDLYVDLVGVNDDD
jgi:hypothetical protein